MFNCKFCENEMGILAKGNHAIDYECNYCRLLRRDQSTISKYYITTWNNNIVLEEFNFKYDNNFLMISNEIKTQLTHIGWGNDCKISFNYEEMFKIPLTENFDVFSIINKVKKLKAFI